MAKIKFENGVTVNFDGTPTQADIEEVAKNLNIQTAAPSRNIAQKTAGFLGIEKFGEGLGVAGALAGKAGKGAEKSRNVLQAQGDKLMDAAKKYAPGDPRRERLIREAQAAYGTVSGGASEISSMGPTTREFLSGAANTALFLAGTGTPGGKVVGKGILGTAKYAPTSILRNVGQAVGQAGLTSLSSQMGQGKGIRESLPGAAKSAAISGIITGGLGLAGKGLSKLSGKATKKLYQTSVPLPKVEREKIIRSEVDDFYDRLVKEGVRGGRKKLLALAQEKGAALAAQMDETLKPGQLAPNAIRLSAKAEEALRRFNVIEDTATGASINTDELTKLLANKAKNTLAGLPQGVTDELDNVFKMELKNIKPIIVSEPIKTGKVTKLLTKFAESTQDVLEAKDPEALTILTKAIERGSLNADEALKLRKTIDTFLPKGAFALEPSAAARTQGLSFVRDELKKQLDNYSPKVPEILKKQQTYKLLGKSMTGALEGKLNKALSLTEGVAGAGGLASFAYGNPTLGAALVAMGLTTEAISNPVIATRVAQILRSSGTFAAKTAEVRRLLQGTAIQTNTK